MFSTSHTNILLPKPNVPILMSAIKQKLMAVPARLLHYKAAFPTSDVTHPDVAFSTGPPALFPLHQLSSQTPVAAGLLHTRSPLRRAPRQVRFLWHLWLPYGQPGIFSVFWLETARSEKLLAQAPASSLVSASRVRLNMGCRAPSTPSPAA